ncbi:AI-2E family transporter [Aerococcaceae bacterium DSM 111020]|nr:AI-2E family transporter [Aerococcaceae bacterium DSM 111020]
MRRYRDRQTLFQRWILNNQVVVSLMIAIIVLVLISLLRRVSYLFTPIASFISLFAFPVIFAGVLFYLFNPLVTRLSRRGIDRRLTIWGIFIVLILLIIWGISTLVPILQNQFQSFNQNLPRYIQQVNQFIENLPFDLSNSDLSREVNAFMADFDLNRLTERLNSLVQTTFGGIGTVIGSITQFVTGLLTMPLILYYLLLESEKIPRNILHVIPNKYRGSASRLMFRANFQVAQYIRGQILVAITVAIMFAIGYSAIGLDYAISLAIIAGFCNVIPFIGSFIAVIPALFIAAVSSPFMLLKVIIVMMIEQTIEGRVVSPQILGSNLEIHPVTILMILLAAGKLFGLTGVILGVPGYAVIKVLVGEFYQYFRETSDLYDDIEEQPDMIVVETEEEQEQ